VTATDCTGHAAATRECGEGPAPSSCNVSPVNRLAFIAALVHLLAWPAAIAVAVIVSRRPLGGALGRGVRRARAGPVEVESGQELAEVRQ
jgi:hypothetical protein